MDTAKDNYRLGLIVGGFFGAILGALVAGLVLTNEFHHWALEHGHAHYDTQTGEFVLEGK